MAIGYLCKRLSKVQYTIITDIWLELFFFTAVALVVTTVTKLSETQLTFSNQLMTVLGTVLGFVISFRASTADSRFTDGRQRWTDIALASRILAQTIWIQVDVDRMKADSEKGQSEGHLDRAEEPGAHTPLGIYIEKRTIMNLHSLRGDPGVYYKDLYPLLAFLPRFHSHDPNQVTEADILPLWKASGMNFSAYKTTEAAYLHKRKTRGHTRSDSTLPLMHDKEMSSDSRGTSSLSELELGKNTGIGPESILPDLPADQELRPGQGVPASFLSHFGLPPFKRIWNPSTWFREGCLSSLDVERKTTVEDIDLKHNSDVPMEIANFLFSYHAWLLKNQYISESTAARIFDSIVALETAVAHLERVKSTPLPFAYQVHLRISVWLYLFFLPSQLYGLFKPVWLTIPATAISAFIMLGFLEIGREIENPFNGDSTDLDMDGFCYAIQRELHGITAHTIPAPSRYVFSDWNQPFAPIDRRTAKEIMTDRQHDYHRGEQGMHSVRQVMIRSWQHVDIATRSFDSA